MAEGQGAEPKVDGRRFAAFISYSHADKDVAAKLQRKLERFRLPKHVALERSNGETAIGTIFRDREDLAAAPSLSAAIRDAIAQSDALIVVCSPDARDSRWVGEEIALFKALHPTRPILAALVRGDHRTAFPDALTAGGTEPLAADLRKEGDGESLGFLKIVAGIAGVPLDALIQRDAQRRVRRVTWITAGALAAMLVMGIMTTLAIQARNEAARQRAEAEGLVEYMLTDLRKKLVGVGRLDIMGSVNERAMQYYGGDSVKGKTLKAAALLAQGEDAGNNGNKVLAESSFRKAYRITDILLKTRPTEPDVIFAHAQSEYWLGYSLYSKKDYQKAKPHWRRYLTLARSLSSSPGEHGRAAIEIGYASNNLCVLAVDLKRSAKEPIARCGEAVDAQRQIAKDKPGDPQVTLSLANSLAWHADALKADGQNGQAKRLRLEQLALIDGLLNNDPRNLDLAEFRITALTAIAKLDALSGRRDAARSTLLSLRADAAELVRSDPQNATWKKRRQQIETELAKLQKEH